MEESATATIGLSEAQQAQLRAQIIVYGSILRDRVPEDTLMNLCFADISGGQTVDFHEGSFRRAEWEPVLIAAATRKAKKKKVAAPPEKQAEQPPLSPAQQAKKPASAKPPPVPAKRTVLALRKPALPAEQPDREKLSEPDLENLAASILAHDLLEERASPSLSVSEVTPKDNSETDDQPTLHEIPKSMFPKGTRVEIAASEVGLRGAWYSGTVLRSDGTRVQVVYDELLDDDGRKLEEWVAYQTAEDAAPRVRPPHPVTAKDLPIDREPFAIGERVDAWINDGWWEGIVEGVNSENNNEVTLSFPADGEISVVGLGLLRRSLRWDGGKWVPWEQESPRKRKSSAAAAAAARKMTTRSLEVKKKKVEAPPVILEGKRKREKPKRLAEMLDEEQDEAPKRKKSARIRNAAAAKRKR